MIILFNFIFCFNKFFILNLLLLFVFDIFFVFLIEMGMMFCDSKVCVVVCVDVVLIMFFKGLFCDDLFV